MKKSPYAQSSESRVGCASCGAAGALFWFGRHLRCMPCGEARLRPPMPLTVGNLLTETLGLLRAVGLPSMLLQALVSMPIAWLVWTNPPNPDGDLAAADAILMMYWLLLTPPIQGAITELGLQHLDGDGVRPLAALGAGLRHWPSLVMATLAATVIVGFNLLLLVIPGLYRATSYLLVVPIIMDREARSVDALWESAQRLRGHMVMAFTVACVTFAPTIGWLVFDVLSATAAMTPSLAALEVLSDTVLLLPMTLASVALHGRLRRPVPFRPPLSSLSASESG